ncbi:hypothetical protein D3C71_1365340 [compost metagenome]
MRSIQSSGVPWPNFFIVSRFLDSARYSSAPRHITVSSPRVWGLWGSSTVSHLAWCLRWIATHSLVTMPVPIHSQKRKKCEGMACKSSARCACARCRKIVTAAMVMWVVARVYRMICHQARFHNPWPSQSMAAFSTAQSGNSIFRKPYFYRETVRQRTGYLILEWYPRNRFGGIHGIYADLAPLEGQVRPFWTRLRQRTHPFGAHGATGANNHCPTHHRCTAPWPPPP